MSHLENYVVSTFHTRWKILKNPSKNAKKSPKSDCKEGRKEERKHLDFTSHSTFFLALQKIKSTEMTQFKKMLLVLYYPLQTISDTCGHKLNTFI